MTLLKHMKINGKEYPIYEMENKKCLKPPTSWWELLADLNRLIETEFGEKNIIRGTTEGHDIMMKTMGIWMEQSVWLRPAIQFRKVLQAFI